MLTKFRPRILLCCLYLRLHPLWFFLCIIHSELCCIQRKHHTRYAIPISTSHRIVLSASKATNSLVPHAYPALNKAERHAVSMDTSLVMAYAQLCLFLTVLYTMEHHAQYAMLISTSIRVVLSVFSATLWPSMVPNASNISLCKTVNQTLDLFAPNVTTDIISITPPYVWLNNYTAQGKMDIHAKAAVCGPSH